MIPSLVLAAATVMAAPAEIRPANAGEALRAGCTVRHVHTPAGKPVATSPVIRCDGAALARLRELRSGEAVARR